MFHTISIQYLLLKTKSSFSALGSFHRMCEMAVICGCRMICYGSYTRLLGLTEHLASNQSTGQTLGHCKGLNVYSCEITMDKQRTYLIP